MDEGSAGPSLHPIRERIPSAVFFLQRLCVLPRGGISPSAAEQTALEATQGQMDGLLSHLPCKCYLEEVVSVGEGLKIFPRLDAGVARHTQDSQGRNLVLAFM